MKKFFLGCSALAGIAAISASAAAQEFTWSVGYVNAVGSSYVATIETVPDRIAAATDGRVQLELYDTLVAGPEQPAAVRDGRLDATFAVTPWLSAEAPIMNFGHLPGLLTDVGVYQQMLDPMLRDEMAAVWAAQYNAQQLMTGVFEDQCIISLEPLESVGAFDGIRVRVHNTEAAALMDQIGAVPTPVPFSEIVPALQRGIVDAIMTSVGTANGFGFHTVADHISIWRIGTVVPWSFIVNNDAWDALPDDLKEAVAAEFRAIEDEHFANHASYSQAAIDALEANGMTVHYASPDEMTAMFADGNVEAVYANWYELNEGVGTDGRALVDRIIEMRDEIAQ